MPPDGGGTRRATSSRRARRVADYIAGMTDRYALTNTAACLTSPPDLR